MGYVFEDWELEVRAVNIDLTTDEGFQALDHRAAEDAMGALHGAHWDAYAGVTLDAIADELTQDFQQESVTLPKGSFADAERAGRELRIVYRVYRRMALDWLRQIVIRRMTSEIAAFPSGHASTPAPAQQTAQRGRHKRS